MIGTPIQIAGLSGQALQGVVMKQEPGETGSSQGLTITPVSLASHSQHVSVLQMGEVSDMGNKREIHSNCCGVDQQSKCNELLSELQNF